MFCSTIIATIGRDKLDRAVQSVLDQNFPQDQFEIIIANDSGEPLPDYDWRSSDQVKIINTQKRERCFARNSAAALAKGRFLHILDDDDWVGPDFLADFYASVSNNPKHVLFYGATQLVQRNGNPLIKLNHQMRGNCFTQVMAGEWIPLQSSLIRTDAFFKAGGLDPMVVGGEDIDLLRCLALIGDFIELDLEGANIEVGAGQTTTDYKRSPTLLLRKREEMLDDAVAFKRLQNSATNVTWQGHILRIYLTSMVWNFQSYRYWTALGRAGSALYAGVRAFPYFFRPAYWRAVQSPYESKTFLNGFRAANMSVSRR